MDAIRKTLQNPAFKRYFFNSSWMLAEQLLRILSGVFVGIYIARYLGPEQFGILTYVLAISAFILAITRMGMDAVLVRELVNRPEQKNMLMGTAFWLMTFSSAACYVIAGLGIWLTNESTQIKLYAHIASASAFFTSFLTIDYLFQSELKAKYSATCKTISLLFMSLLKLSLIFCKADLFWFVIASLLDHVILAALFLMAAQKSHSTSFLKKFNKPEARSMLRSAWPMVLSAVASLIYMRIDQIMIRNMLGLHDVGVYSAAVKIYESWIVLPYIITISLLPAIARLKQGNEALYQLRITQLFRLVMWMSIIAAIVASIFSEPLIKLAFGPEYAASASTVSIVMWTAVFAAIGSVSARYFNVERMEKKIAVRTALAALINVGLNLILIPLYGINGAAIATLACTFFANYLMDWLDKDLRTLLKIKHRALFGHPFK